MCGPEGTIVRTSFRCMSSSELTQSESSDEEVAPCILDQCIGCASCQSSEALRARERIFELNWEIEDLQLRVRRAQEELEHVNLVRKTVCRHFLIVTREEERCNRCGLVRPRTPTTEGQ